MVPHLSSRFPDPCSLVLDHWILILDPRSLILDPNRFE
jgi:hypothetical protein